MRPDEITDEDIRFLETHILRLYEKRGDPVATKLMLLLESWKKSKVVSDRDYSELTGKSIFEVPMCDREGKQTKYALRLTDGKTTIPFEAKPAPVIRIAGDELYPNPLYRRGQLISAYRKNAGVILGVQRWENSEKGWAYLTRSFSADAHEEVLESDIRIMSTWKEILLALSSVANGDMLIRIGKLKKSNQVASKYLFTEAEIRSVSDL